MRFWYLSHCQAMKAQGSLGKCPDSPEPSLHACSKVWKLGKAQKKVRPPVTHVCLLGAVIECLTMWVQNGSHLSHLIIPDEVGGI